MHLSYGYERWIKRPDERGRVDALLKAILKVKRDAEGNGAKFPEIGVISWRGVMTKYVLRATIGLTIILTSLCIN